MTAPGEQPRLSGRRGAIVLRAVATDVTPLRVSADFRRLFTSQTVSVVGTQVTQVAVPLQVFALTGSSLSVGIVGIAALLPLVVFGVYGGAIADAVDRRRLVLASMTGSGLVSAVLLAQAVIGLRSVGLLYGCVAVQSAFFAVSSPTRRAILPRILSPGDIAAANTLLMGVFSVGVIAGPLVAGALVAGFGYGAAYAVDVAGFFGALLVLRRLPPLPPGEHATRRAGFTSVVQGLDYLRRQPVLLTTFVVDIAAMVFGMRRALFPALAEHQFHAGAQVAGYLYAAPAVGAAIAILAGGWLGAVRRQGVAVLVAVAVWGAAITVFGVVGSLWLALLLLAIAGAADTVSAVFRSTMMQVAAPDEMQGRLAGVYTVVVAGGPRLGDLEAGGVAAAFTPMVSIVSGGLAVLAAVAVVAVVVPSFARYDARHPTA